MTLNNVSIPISSSNKAWARTISPMVMTGKSTPQGLPVSGLMLAGPIVPMHPPKTLVQMMKYRSVSIGLPGPIIVVHQPGLPDMGFVPAANWSPVSAWVTKIAFVLSAFNVP